MNKTQTTKAYSSNAKQRATKVINIGNNKVVLWSWVLKKWLPTSELLKKIEEYSN